MKALLVIAMLFILIAIGLNFVVFMLNADVDLFVLSQGFLFFSIILQLIYNLVKDGE